MTTSVKKTIKTWEGMRIEELYPTDSRASFYGKAKVISTNQGEKILVSYDTLVMVKHTDGKIERLWGGYSATTGRHVAAFADIGKKQWDKMEIGKVYERCEL